MGILIRKLLPDTKIIVCTFFEDSYKIRTIVNAFEPLGFVNKSDMDFANYVSAINDVLDGKRHYSKTIVNVIMQKISNNIVLDDYDILILKELSNGAKMRDLLKLVHLSKSTIDKRIRILKKKFNIQSNSDRDLVLVAREKGII